MLGFCRVLNFNFCRISLRFPQFQAFEVTAKCSSSSPSFPMIHHKLDVSNLPSVPPTKMEYLQKLLLQQPKSPPNARVLKVAVVGCTNSGKSSLVNILTGWKVCAVAGKAHTTRSKQMAALLEDNVQVVFVDLPGLVNTGKIAKFNLEKSFIRDPHAAIHEADLVLVVVDVSHKYSRTELDPEIVKALHFFNDKESILILNKIDKVQNNSTILLDITRKLTGGIVHGKQSHVDAYINRFKRRDKLSNSAHSLISPNEIIASYLPPICHQTVNKFLNHITHLNNKLNLTQVEFTKTDNQLIDSNGNLNLTEKSKLSTDLEPITNSLSNQQNQNVSELLKDRILTDVESESIDAFFNKYKPESHKQIESIEKSVDNTNNKSETIKELDKFTSTDDIETLIENLHDQLLIKTASSLEVANRRKRWNEITLSVKGVKHWNRFTEVFMVSSTTGDGIDSLRKYLVSKALPNRNWILPPSLVTDHEPSELIRMCVWAQCLNKLHDEIPYSLQIIVDDCDKIKLEDGDDRIYVHVRIRCKTERQLKQVLGPAGSTIKEIAGAAKSELMTMFRSNTVVKLTAEMSKLDSKIRKQLRHAKDYQDVFPNYNDSCE